MTIHIERTVTVDNRSASDLIREHQARREAMDQAIRALELELANARLIAQNATLELERLRAEHERDRLRIYTWQMPEVDRG